ncbi:MAG TPA: YidC/Oxa1 family membrane protein insertase [Solirubrobacteraceae bacterium]|jgi:YidC/Oxa1 family membrane protein insertase|nr:YidC/Oxa1 family membrane protein insertase [Solirubrobacteraceae bacterium]
MPIFANIIEEAFSPLISLFEAVLVFIHNHIVGGSWGLAIVGLTVVVRAIMLPPTFSQFRSMRKMQLLAPEMKALKEKHKDDKQRQNEEMMKLYRENKVNPFASCLPLALQLPVFISLFYMLRTDLKKHICGPALKAHGIVTTKAIEKATCNQVDPHSAKFLFVPDVTAKATGVVLVVLLVLYLASQVTSTLLMSASAEPSQRWLMLGLPLVFVVILFRYPAGLLIYWITTNLWTIGQGYFVRRSMGPPPPPQGKATAASGGGSPNGRADGPKGGGGGSSGEPALAGVGAGSAPPPPPRKKKKRSGRRR